MLSSNMHPRIAELAKDLLPLTEKPPERPTQADRLKLMTLRDKLKRLSEEVELDATAETDRRYLYVVATREANRQEEFFANNGDQWAA